MLTESVAQERPRKRRPRDRVQSTRVYYAAGQPPLALAVWTSRLAIFAAVAALVTAVLHRLTMIATPVAMTIAAAVIAGAILALVMAAFAGLDIWITGRQGTARVVCGALVALMLLAIPAGLWVLSWSWPEISDISTDVNEPPDFTDAKEARDAKANPTDYPGARVADLQRQNYPDLKSLVLPRSTDESYEIVLQALTKLKYRTTLELPPEDEENAPGFIEFSDHSLILGLFDDVVVRVLAGEGSSRIDVRSAARYGQNDFGRNAERVRGLLKEIAARYEASVPDPEKDAARKAKAEKNKVKSPKARGPASKADRRRPDPSRAGIRRGPERKASQPGASSVRGSGRPRGQFDE